MIFSLSTESMKNTDINWWVSVIIPAIVSIFLFLFQSFIKTQLDRVGKINIYSKIISIDERHPYWGIYKTEVSGTLALMVPVKIEIVNRKNSDYIIRDFNIYIKDSEDNIISKMVFLEYMGGKTHETIYGNDGSNSFLIPQKSILRYKMMFGCNLNNNQIANICKLDIEYFDIKEKKHTVHLKKNIDTKQSNLHFPPNEDWQKIK